MRITGVFFVPVKSGFYFDDQRAIKQNAKQDGLAYMGAPVTQGFTSIRMAGEAISVMLMLEDGQYAYGDCAAVQYSGAGGRDPLFLARDFIPLMEENIKPWLLGKELGRFREMAAELDHMKTSGGGRLHTAIRYGVSQALLDAAAKAQHKLMAQVIAEEYGLTISDKMIPIFSQSGDDRYINADKMIIKGSDVLPHALFNTREKIGNRGENLLAYVKWLRDRIMHLRPSAAYNPVLHIDVYGTIGLVFDQYADLVDYLGVLEEAAKPFKLRIEGPVDMGEKEAQIQALADIRGLEEAQGVHVEIVADEWCNTLEDIMAFTDRKAGHMAQIKTPDLGSIHNSIEAVLYCRKHGMGAYLGGTCNETERSAQICCHIAMATSPIQCLAKPGMGVDEGYMIAYNEMQRILAITNGFESKRW